MSRFPPIWNAGLLALAALALAACGKSSDSEQPPSTAETRVSNVVMIGIDTVRFDSWHIPERTDTEDAFTPWLARSQTFAQAIAPSPWTVPAVASILTGLYPSQHGGGLFEQPVANLAHDFPSTITPAATTLASWLSEQGVKSQAVSAHPWFQANYGMQRGFDQLGLRKQAPKVVEYGLQWYDRQRAADPDQRNFLYLHFMEAHDRHLDLDASRKFVEAMPVEERERLLRTAPPEACGDADADMCARYLIYADAVLELRQVLADLLEALERSGALEDTLVVLYSDHGEEFHDHYDISVSRHEDPRDIYGFGHGQSLYQELLHVPLQLWHPELPGKEIDTPVSLVDVMPSILEWFGESLPPDIQYPGRSFAGLVERDNAPPFEWSKNQLKQDSTTHRNLFASGIAYGPEQMAVIREGRKLIWHQSDNERELYDLRQDAHEKNPLDLDSTPLVDVMDDALDQYFEWFDSRDYLAPEISDDVIESLKGVGYLQGVESGKSAPQPEADDDSN
ncbi:MAG: sulfatase [Xanthomonadaceae bacterium]|nr:sulfatase [Xanthomonadaceae bacterium]